MLDSLGFSLSLTRKSVMLGRLVGGMVTYRVAILSGEHPIILDINGFRLLIFSWLSVFLSHYVSLISGVDIIPNMVYIL